MRGKAIIEKVGQANPGITPAHAGKSCTGLFESTSEKDHPRACGEKHSVAVDDRRVPGSPPRMRGKD